MRDNTPTASDVERPYPRRCFACGKDTVNQTCIPHDAKVRHDGKLHAFHIPSLQIDQCEHCGEQYFTSDTDEQINLGLRKHLGLLTPQDIRSGIESCKVSQKTFAEHLGIAQETVSRWLNEGVTQTRSLDKMMRLYFAMPSVRSALADERGIQAVAENPAVTVGKGGLRSELQIAFAAETEVVEIKGRFRREFTQVDFSRSRSFSLIAGRN